MQKLLKKGGEIMKLLTAYEASEILGIDVDSTYRCVRQGILPCVYIGRRVRFSEDQINEFIAVGGKRIEKGVTEYAQSNAN